MTAKPARPEPRSPQSDVATPRRVDPAMQAWIDEQKKNFKPGDLDDAIRVMRAHSRANREKARREQAGEAA